MQDSSWIKSITESYKKDVVNFKKPTAALLIIDMINEFCSPNGWCDLNKLDYKYCEKCIKPLQNVIKIAREKNIPIIWGNWGIVDVNQLPKNQFYLWKKKPSDIGLLEAPNSFRLGSKGVEIIPQLKKEKQDILINKERIDCFFQTNLDSVLKNLNIDTLLIAGVNTDQCVLHTMAQGNFLGYTCIMLKDCCSTNSPKPSEDSAIYEAGECFGFVKNSTENIWDNLTQSKMENM